MAEAKDKQIEELKKMAQHSSQTTQNEFEKKVSSFEDKYTMVVR